MNKLVLVAAGALFCANLALAQATAPAPKAAPAAQKKRTPQQEKMVNCNKEAKAKNLAGDARKAFMKECLSSKPVVRADSAKGSAKK